MKRKNVKKLIYGIRMDIIDEIGELNRMNKNTQMSFVKHYGSFEYGYKRGLTEAAMIMLDRIYETFPEEKEEE